MEKPNIPVDLNPEICIDRYELVNLLLYSIALEEISLSNLLKTEAELLSAVLKEHKCKPNIDFAEFYRINRSAGDTIRLISEKETTLLNILIKVIHFSEDQGCECC